MYNTEWKILIYGLYVNWLFSLLRIQLFWRVFFNFIFFYCILAVKSFLPSYVCPKISLIRMHHFSGSLSSFFKKGILINEVSMRIAWTKTHPQNLWKMPDCSASESCRFYKFCSPLCFIITSRKYRINMVTAECSLLLS